MKNELKPKELGLLQAVLLELLSEFDRICRVHNLEYTLSGGTLLGAVRHGGFIPWDDDADVSMKRSEYDKFRELCKTELDEGRFFFQDHTTDPEYPWGYGRLRRKDSEFVRVGQEHMKMQTGIFLDIFPNDYIPNFYPLRLLHSFCCFMVRKTLYAESGRVKSPNIVARLFYHLLSKIPRKTVFGFLEKLVSTKPSRYCRALTFPSPKDIHLGTDVRYYGEYEDIEFAGKVFRVMKHRHDYLSYNYGDYMQLPPPEKRHWHPAAVISFPPEYIKIEV
jgi:lipopolysaccharide cholinephosphotransferase